MKEVILKLSWSQDPLKITEDPEELCSWVFYGFPHIVLEIKTEHFNHRDAELPSPLISPQSKGIIITRHRSFRKLHAHPRENKSVLENHSDPADPSGWCEGTAGALRPQLGELSC